MYYISSDKSLLQRERMLQLLRETYWAGERTPAQMETAIDHSVCFGAYLTENGQQIGLVRVVTDFVCAFYVCDVVVDPAYRGCGVSKALLERALSDSRYAHLRVFIS